MWYKYRDHLDNISHKARGLRWCIVGDWNYDGGSYREHAALEPRFLGGVAVIARSFARIHETNLKKQGMLPLTFMDPANYDRIKQGDVVTLLGGEEGEIQPCVPVTMSVESEGGGVWKAELRPSHSEVQTPWLRAGSALNYIKQNMLGDHWGLKKVVFLISTTPISITQDMKAQWLQRFTLPDHR